MLGIDALHDTVKSWFTSFWARAREIFSKNLGWTVGFWGVVLSATNWIWSILDWVNHGVSGAVHFLDDWIAPTIGAPSGWLMDRFTVANTFFPIEDVLGMVVAYLGLLSLLAGFKILKRAIGWFFGL